MGNICCSSRDDVNPQRDTEKQRRGNPAVLHLYAGLIENEEEDYSVLKKRQRNNIPTSSDVSEPKTTQSTPMNLESRVTSVPDRSTVEGLKTFKESFFTEESSDQESVKEAESQEYSVE